MPSPQAAIASLSNDQLDAMLQTSTQIALGSPTRVHDTLLAWVIDPLLAELSRRERQLESRLP